MSQEPGPAQSLQDGVWDCKHMPVLLTMSDVGERGVKKGTAV